MLNPDREHGKLILATGLGEGVERLDGLVAALRALDMPAVWMCDPVRANTSTQGDVALRAAIAELEQTVARHAALGSRLSGMVLDTCADPLLDFPRSLQLCSNLVHAYRSVA